MSNYGFNNVTGVPWTGYSNTIGNGPANEAATGGQVYFNGFTQHDDRIVKQLRNGGRGLALRRVITTLLGAAAGGTATETKKQIKWEQGSPGGLIPIESVTIINRVTTSGDVTGLNSLLFRSPAPATYVADASGNGGGGKQTAAGGSAF